MDQLQDFVARIGMNRIFILVGFALAGFLFLRWFGKTEASTNTIRVRCSCGWTGMASRLKPRCPLCGSPIDVLRG
jgi:hypothetical protein